MDLRILLTIVWIAFLWYAPCFDDPEALKVMLSIACLVIASRSFMECE